MYNTVYISYCNVTWGATFCSYLFQLFNLQKKLVRLPTFSKLDTPKAPLLYESVILNVLDINTVLTCVK